MNGWICLHRSIQDHWIFDKDDYFRAWIVMLMEVNHKQNRALINGVFLTCDRGESVLSKSSWAKKFGKNWNRKKVERFFKYLENDHMIVQQNVHVTTKLSICNYGKYQDKIISKRPSDEPPERPTHVQPTSNPRPQPNNDNNDNKYSSSPSDGRKKFAMHIGWKPNFDDRTKLALRQTGLNPDDEAQQLKNYIAAKIDDVGDERTQHEWNKSFKNTLMKFCLNTGSKNATSQRPSKPSFNAAAAITASAIESHDPEDTF